MILRPYQQRVILSMTTAVSRHPDTMIVAPTGAGKTVILSAAIAALEGQGARRFLILQHRSELVDQNSGTFLEFSKVARGRVGIVQASRREWSRDYVFGMIQTVSGALDEMPAFDAILIDECHHVAAESYLATIAAARARNPRVKVIGVTATPSRGDKKGLGKAFTNCADMVDLFELLEAGILVRPRVLVQDVGVTDELLALHDSEWGDQSAVAEIMQRTVVSSAVLTAWRQHAGDRVTVFFCPDVETSESYAAQFQAAGVSAAAVHSRLPDAERSKILADFKAGRVQVLFNPLLLTEGFDHQPVSCVGLLRKSSQKPTLIQMVGRGLRRVDPARFPGILKGDCVVLDFGASFVKHNDLFCPVDLSKKEPGGGAGPTKECKECGWEVPRAARECPNCGHEFPVKLRTTGGALLEVRLVEKDILKGSPFKWTPLYDGKALVASGGTACAFVLRVQGVWHALGHEREGTLRLLHSGEKEECLAVADDHMRRKGDPEFAGKSASWLRKPPSDRQVSMLRDMGLEPAGQYSRYEASCRLDWGWKRKAIERLVAGGARVAA